VTGIYFRLLLIGYFAAFASRVVASRQRLLHRGRVALVGILDRDADNRASL
jgi:hypothetical protein